MSGMRHPVHVLQSILLLLPRPSELQIDSVTSHKDLVKIPGTSIVRPRNTKFSAAEHQLIFVTRNKSEKPLGTFRLVDSGTHALNEA
jgi:hypothetical protein